MKKYPGQKKINGLYHKIINQIPKHEVYYEIFAGTGAIGKLLIEQNCKAYYYFNDIDTKIAEQLYSELITNAKHQILKSEISIWNNRAGIILTQLRLQDYKHKILGNSFVFIDAPYLLSTRHSNTPVYSHEFTDLDHKQLLLQLPKLNCNIMVVHPECEVYDKHLKGWRKVLVKVRYNNKTSIDCLYMNYEEPKLLQTDAFLGKDCWDRQRIKRKSDNLIKKLKALPDLERKFIIKRVLENVA